MKDSWEAYVADTLCVDCDVVVDVAVVGTWRWCPRGWGEIRRTVTTRGGGVIQGGSKLHLHLQLHLLHLYLRLQLHLQLQLQLQCHLHPHLHLQWTCPLCRLDELHIN